MHCMHWTVDFCTKTSIWQCHVMTWQYRIWPDSNTQRKNCHNSLAVHTCVALSRGRQVRVRGGGAKAAVQCLGTTSILIEACPWTIIHTRQKYHGVRTADVHGGSKTEATFALLTSLQYQNNLHYFRWLNISEMIRERAIVIVKCQ